MRLVHAPNARPAAITPMSIPEWYKKLAGERIDDFVLDEYVGCGKIGAVYRSHQHDIPSRTVAIKVVPGQPRPGWENEIRKVVLLADIQGVVHFHQVGEKRPTLVAKELAGYVSAPYSLQRRVKERANLPSGAV
jgi:hypothetical protein